MSPAPPPTPQLSLFSLFGELDYLIRAQSWQCQEMLAQRARQEQFMTVLDDKLDALKTQVDAMTTNSAAEAAEVAQVHTSLSGLVAVVNDLRATAGLSAEQAARLDSAVQAVADASGAAAAQTAQLAADQNAANTAAAPPAAAPPPPA